MEIPTIFLEEILAHFGLQLNCYYRRVSKEWQASLSKVFEINHLSIDLSMSPRSPHTTTVDHPYHSFGEYIPKKIEEWFVAQQNVQRSRGVLIFGHDQTFVGLGEEDIFRENIKKGMAETHYTPSFYLWAHIRLTAADLLDLHIPSRVRETEKTLPLGCRIILKDCWLTGINWFLLLPHNLTKTLLTIRVTEMEVVNIGRMGKGQRRQLCPSSYQYGEGEAEVFSRELLRLGRKYVVPMSDKERRTLESTVRYYWYREHNGYFQEFPSHVTNLIQKHEPELHAVSGSKTLRALGRLYSHSLKLKPLTERLLEALMEDCSYV